MTPGTKKIILWLVAISVGAGLLIVWARSVPERLKSFPGRELFGKFNLPKLDSSGIEIPGEKIKTKVKELEEAINETETK